MNNKAEQILSSVQAICRAENEDLAGLNGLLAGEMMAALPASLRQDILQTELGRQIQANVWQLWLTTTNERLSNDDIEETLIELADEMLVRKSSFKDGMERLFACSARLAVTGPLNT
ncbi:MAG: hypothetical protein HS126_24705 [Anaerolineales bacterium]|nr:hypothetical protein [Anaerolineales bacterium]